MDPDNTVGTQSLRHKSSQRRDNQGTCWFSRAAVQLYRENDFPLLEKKTPGHRNTDISTWKLVEMPCVEALARGSESPSLESYCLHGTVCNKHRMPLVVLPLPPTFSYSPGALKLPTCRPTAHQSLLYLVILLYLIFTALRDSYCCSHFTYIETDVQKI